VTAGLANSPAVDGTHDEPGKKWWALLDSNQRTVGYEPNALPLS
jgi:hypothetical protein